MRNSIKSLKVILMACTIMLFIYALHINERPAHAFQSGPDPGFTGAPALGTAPAELTCNTAGCHFGNTLNAVGGTFQILDVPASYIPGQEYTIRVSLSRSNRVRFGFQITALNSDGTMAGTVTATDTARTQKVSGTVGSINRDYIEHTGAGTTPSSTDKSEWSFKWTAPATRGGKITFYAAGNAANGAGSAGDFIYTTSAVIRPEVVSVNGASFSSSAPLTSTSDGILSGFGLDMATSTATATGDADPNMPGIQLPTTLAGTTIKVRDALNVERDAGLFYVDPTQINYLLPSNLAPGAATVTITASNNVVSTGRITIAAVQPGIFTAAQNGSGLAAAEIQRVRNGQTIGFEPVWTGGPPTPTAVPIEWKDPGDELYLVLYGTGMRGRSMLSNVLAIIGGGSQQVVFAGGHSVFAGLDQVNILLNRNLATRGEVDAVLTVDGKAANTVKLNFK